MNAGDNINDQQDFGFTGSFFKIAPTAIDNYTKKKFLNVQLENLRPKRNIDNKDKKSDKFYQIHIFDDQVSD